MAILGERQFVERLKFFDGQRLFAQDLDALDGFHQQMRWLHNQSLHQPGVGRGFAVAGNKGDKIVTVQEGYAIDRDGREIVLTLPRSEPIPPVTGDNGQPAVYDLAVKYPTDNDLDISETRQGICVSPGAVRRREEPVFCWVRIGADGQPIDPDLKSDMAAAYLIRLARAKVLECKLYADISIAERRNARPPQQPFMACGIAGGNDLKWEAPGAPKVLQPDDVKFVNSLGTFLKAKISTKSAGFRTTPGYFVEIRGKKLYTPPVPGTAGDSFVVDGVASVTGPSPTDFTIEVDVLVQRFTGTGGVTIDVDTFAGWQVTWMGVEG